MIAARAERKDRSDPGKQLVRYQPPSEASAVSLKELVASTGRGALSDQQLSFLRSREGSAEESEVCVFYQGDLALLSRKSVSIVGTREVSEAGWLRAARLARELAGAGVTVMSGLAKGVDTAALTAAIKSGGHVAAVIGTPLSKAYPAENAQLQEEIWRHHLLVTPFAEGEPTYRGNFPRRNRVMATLSDATVIVEASDTSGTLHQAAECQRLGRWLFIMKSVADNHNLKWPASFLGKPRTMILEYTSDILSAIET